ncbi:hypothetical protein LTR66_005868 [Elasticomyces elasticus]|nr:hypothetical protein LTR66_005868 [Elasticomyces elasticus]
MNKPYCTTSNVEQQKSKALLLLHPQAFHSASRSSPARDLPSQTIEDRNLQGFRFDVGGDTSSESGLYTDNGPVILQQAPPADTQSRLLSPTLFAPTQRNDLDIRAPSLDWSIGDMGGMEDMLLHSSIDDRALTKNGESPRSLVESSSNVQPERLGTVGMTALHQAARNGHLGVVQRLMERGADLEALSGSGQTVLHFAAEGGHIQVMEYLLGCEVAIDSEDFYGLTAVHKAASNGQAGIVQRLIERGANLESLCGNDWTALDFAAENGHLHVVQLLLGFYVDLNRRDSLGQTALHRAAIHGNEPMVTLLVDAGADVESRMDNMSDNESISNGRQPTDWR